MLQKKHLSTKKLIRQASVDAEAISDSSIKPSFHLGLISPLNLTPILVTGIFLHLKVCLTSVANPKTHLFKKFHHLKMLPPLGVFFVQSVSRWPYQTSECYSSLNQKKIFFVCNSGVGKSRASPTRLSSWKNRAKRYNIWSWNWNWL